MSTRGFKVFNPDWTCRGYKFEVGGTYEEDVKPSLCNSGFHFCERAVDCFNYYSFEPNNKVAEIAALGTVVNDGGDKSCTDRIHIIREVPWSELLGIVNTGKSNSGLGNSGNGNSGNWNSGNWNSGNWNSGNGNSGNGNSGNGNSGNWNSGNRNSGNGNSGNGNSGNGNSGNWNSGNWNSGNWNSGNGNSGNGNSGNGNSGNWNSGNRNSGNGNSGNGNSGNWNSGNGNSGVFNTEDHNILLFDKPSDFTLDEWRNTNAYYLLNRIPLWPTEWICESDMTKKEKNDHPEYETTGGYLKDVDTSDCCKDWWNGLSERERETIQAIPNFDAEKFYKITGIRL